MIKKGVLYIYLPIFYVIFFNIYVIFVIDHKKNFNTFFYYYNDGFFNKGVKNVKKNQILILNYKKI